MKKSDLILISSLLAIGIIFIIFQFISSGKDGKEVVITVEEKQYKVLDLNTDTEIKIVNSKGDYNILKIQDGKVWMTDSNCKNQICVKTGKISKTGETIVCLPHQVVVKIVSDSD